MRPYINLFLILAGLGIGTIVILGGIGLITGEGTFLGPIWASILGFFEGLLTWLFDPNKIPVDAEIVHCSADSGCSIVHALLFSAVFLLAIITGFAYTTLLERRFIAFFQQRTGPNRVGPIGLLQPLADAIKLIFKEDIMPTQADRWVYLIAPILKAVPTLILLAVVPFGPDLLIPLADGRVFQVPLGLADLNIGVLWLLAITSISTYGVVLAGWASNSKYAMLGGLRSTAQMISYELSFGLTVAVPVMIVGSLALGDIIREQTYIWEWFVFQNPLAAAILLLALLAEVSRAPFDLPEAEQELTQGYMTEYSGMKFALFMMAEYLGMIGVSVVAASLYFGGYQDGFGIVDSIPILGPVVLIGKVVLLLIGMVWIRATLPRIRYDRLMALGWKVLLPLSLVAVSWTAISVLVGDLTGNPVVYGVVSGIFFVVVFVGGLIVLRRAGEPAEREELPEDDPIITGERRGPAYAGLLVLGGLLAIPFALWNFTLSVIDGLSNLAPGRGETETSDETAITPTEGASGGSD
ncbi:MAG: NADH-quinone oxidoreductase subunit NuoH [Chloroflexi bacterium]|nr:NADH-quinone oxidoreductase subunit NuoH [Chloroflexota bacterium]